ncbi:GcrA family cell cycle regulator [Bosea sp. 2YAB26]|uniref:GcrA family cell cycle regulator n=1 Tax=Bosea sp. 2YAB26 TaxID=3237478 RepID=UPI003F905179
MTTFAWTHERIDAVRVLHAQGCSSKEIAVSIGAPTRNTVIGKMRRLGLQRIKQLTPKKASLKRQKPSAPALSAKVIGIAAKGKERQEMFQAVADKALDKFERTIAAAQSTFAAVRFLDRSRFECSMPQPGWDDAPIDQKMVCGRPVVGGTSWCAHCLTIVAVPAGFARYKDGEMRKGIAA